MDGDGIDRQSSSARMRPGRPKRLLGGLLSTTLVATGLMLVVAPARPAFAASLFTDSPSYGPNAVITITGQTDYVTNCPAGGTNDVFGQSTARVYIIPEATAEGIVDGSTLADVQPFPHVVIDDPTAGFLNEPIGFTQPAGHVGPGTYALVVDECQDHIFHAGIDDVFLDSFTVAFPGGTSALPAIDPTIANIKADAKNQAARWAKTLGSLALLFTLEKAVPGDFGNTLIGMIEGQVSNYTKVDPRADSQTLVANEVVRYASVAADPPDPNFTLVAPLQTSAPLLASENDPLDLAATALGNQANIDDGTTLAVLNAMQRYEGAQQANDLQSGLSQARALQGYASDLAGQLPRTNASLTALSNRIGALPASFDTQSAQLAPILREVKANGLNSDQAAELSALGIPQATIDQAIADLETEPAGATRAQLQATIGQLMAENTQAATDYHALATDATNGLPALINTLQTEENTADAAAANAQNGSSSPTPILVVHPGPTSVPGGPYTGTVGAPIALDGSASTAATGTTLSSFAWDDDGTGNFTSATGAKPSITVSHPFDGFVGLQVTDSNGRPSIAYTRLTVTSSATAPTVTAFSPTTDPRVGPSGSQAFAVTASPANAGYQWSVDGTVVPAATGPGFTYHAPASTGFHLVKVVVTGSDPNGGSDTVVWNVEVLAASGVLAHLDLTPSAATGTAGAPQGYLAEGWANTVGGDLGDVTGHTSFSITPDGSCTGATCTPAASGVHTVTGTATTTGGTAMGTATLTVPGSGVARLVLNPATGSISAGGSQPYTAEGFDAANNDLGDVTAMTTFAIAPDGSCTGATCTATTPGAHTVTGTDAAATGTASLTVEPAGADPVGTIYVADFGANRIDVFAPGAQGNVAPIRTISGPLSGVVQPGYVAVDPAGDVYSSNYGANTITEYAPGASGNVAPIRTIGGSNTGLHNPEDMSFASDGTLYVGNYSGGNVVVFAPGATGNAVPERTITTLNAPGADTDGVGVDATGTLYANDSPNATIDVFAPGANGAATPIRKISGPATGVSFPDDVKVDFSGNLLVTDLAGEILAFAPGANGNATPIRVIAGPNTGLPPNANATDDLAVDAAGTIYVTNFTARTVLEFAPGANGNVAPVVSLAGSATSFSEPEGVAVATEPPPTLATTASASTIGLGSATSDTATLTGNNPSGSMIFKLFGPNDPNCALAPAFISPVLTVSGNGSYPSAASTPVAPGTYSWLALYSGDIHNAPASTTCNDPAESVTVVRTTPKPTLTYTGATTGDHGDTVTLAGTLTSTTTTLHVFTGYADIRDTNFPNPWVGAAGVVCMCDTALAAAGDPDESAIRIDNPSNAAIKISDVAVKCGGGNTLDLWGSPIVPAGDTLILSGTPGVSFDGSDLCAQPDTVTVTVNGVTTTFNDPAHAIPGGPTSANETIAWSPIGSIAGVGGAGGTGGTGAGHGVAGKALTLTLGSQSCTTGPTDSQGVATCNVTAAGDPGLVPAGGSFGGDSADAATTAPPVSFTVTPEETVATYTGATTGDFNDPVTLAGTLTDGETPPVPIPGKALVLSAGTQSCSGITDSTGVASCSITPTQAAGAVNAGAKFGGDIDDQAATSPAVVFTITKEQTTLSITGPTIIGQATTITEMAFLAADGLAVVNRTVAFAVGTGASAQTCHANTDTSGVARCSITGINQAPGAPATCGTGAEDLSGSTSCTVLAVTASFAGDGFYGWSSAAPAAVLAAITCNATITGNVGGAVIISHGTSCLNGATVGGAVVVSAGATVVILNSTVHGAVVTNAARAVTVCNSTLGGGLSVQGSTGSVLIGAGNDASVPCAGNTIAGGVIIGGSGSGANRGGVELSGNTINGGVGGSVVVIGNIAPNGGTPTEDRATEIEANTINGALTCNANNPAPTNDGEPNQVIGSRSGQCSGI